MKRAVLGTLLVTACGAAATEAGTPETIFEEPEGEAPVEQALVTTDGQMLFVGDLRGEVVVLFLFATFDGVSQASIRPLSRLARHRPGVRIVAIAVQPNPALLADAYAHALHPPFPITYDPDERIRAGTSMLGKVDAVPTFVVLDRRGAISARHVGFASERQLTEMADEAAAAAAAPPRRSDDLPLMGQSRGR